MKTYALCPVSDARVDEHAARIGALLTVALLAMFILTRSLWPILLLALDFLLRAIPSARHSPVAIASGWLAQRLPLLPRPINAGPKILAARIGFAMASMTLIGHIVLGGPAPAALAALLGLFALLEGAFGICVACRLYPWLYKLLYRDNFAG